MQKQTIQSELPENFLPFFDFLKRQELSEELITAISDELFVHQKEQEAPLAKQQMKEIAKNVLRRLLADLPMGARRDTVQSAR